MRHGDKINNLGRTKSHRQALLRNLAIAIINHKKIVTTLPKARALRTFVEPLLTRAKTNTTHARRITFSYLQNKEAIKELFDNISPKIASRNGGYTRIIKLGQRVGDGANMAYIELVDYNTTYVGNQQKPIKAKRTRRGGAAKTTKPTIKPETQEKPEIIETQSNPEVSSELVASTKEETKEIIKEITKESKAE